MAHSAFPSPTVFESTVKAVVFALFLACGYSAVPLMIKLFLAGQRSIGNAAAAPIVWLEAHEVAVVVGVWLFVSLGVAIAVPAAISDGFFASSGEGGAIAQAKVRSQGLLVAASGMTVDEMFRRSSPGAETYRPEVAGVTNSGALITAVPPPWTPMKAAGSAGKLAMA